MTETEIKIWHFGIKFLLLSYLHDLVCMEWNNTEIWETNMIGNMV